MPREWMSAADAFRQVAAVTGPEGTPRAICSRAHAGLINSKAARLVIDDRTGDDVEIPKRFWWACGQAALTQNWATGDFETWIDKTIHLKAFGVSFSRAGIDALAAPAEDDRRASADPPPNPGGRPAAAWWDDLWIEICRQLWIGDLKPDKQSDLESAMMDWTLAHGHSPAVSTIRLRARKLWAALRREDGN